MSTQSFEHTYCPHGAIALRDFTVEPTRGDTVTCHARITSGTREQTLTATAVGAIGAMTEMLYGMGAGVEIVSLSQHVEGDDTIVYLLCERNGRQSWSYGRGRASDEAAVNALIAGANQLAETLA